MSDYSNYISSYAWAQKRKARLEIDGHRCRLCGRTGDEYRLEVHHTTYKNFRHEDVENDLITLCVRCHDVATSNRQRDKDNTKKYIIEPIEDYERQEINHDLASKEVSVERIDPAADAQWISRLPEKQMGTFEEGDYLEEKEDRSR